MSSDVQESIIAWSCMVIAFLVGGLLVVVGNTTALLIVGVVLSVIWFTKVAVDIRAERQ